VTRSSRLVGSLVGFVALMGTFSRTLWIALPLGVLLLGLLALPRKPALITTAVLAALAAAGILDLSVFEHVRYPLPKINEAISGIAQRNGGFSNFVIMP